MAAGTSAAARAQAQRAKIRRLEESAERWERGAEGERKTAELLEPLTARGYVVLHDLAVPGSRANIDHVVVGPSGVTVIDSKAYRAKLTIDHGTLWAGRWPQTSRLQALAFEADAVQRSVDRVAPGVAVRRMVCFHGTAVPRDRDGVLGPVVLCGPDDLIAAVTSPGADPLPSSRVTLIATAIETLHGERAPTSPPDAPIPTPTPTTPAAPLKRTAPHRRTSAAATAASAGAGPTAAGVAAKHSGIQLIRAAMALVCIVLCILIAGHLIRSLGSQSTSFGTTTTQVTVEDPST